RVASTRQRNDGGGCCVAVRVSRSLSPCRTPARGCREEPTTSAAPWKARRPGGDDEIRISTHSDAKMWAGRTPVTFESYRGGRLTGSFHGTLTSQNTPATPPVRVADGVCSVNVGA